jgi:hypothetical protein
MPMTFEELRDATRWTPAERAAFVARFPRLHHWPDGRERTFFSACGRGWISLLERVYILAEADERAIIGQIKEKYGGLRVYLEHGSVNPELLRVIDEVEAKSESMCEVCGADARTAESARGWIRTLCDAHLLDGARFLPPEIPVVPSPDDA